MSGDRYGKHRTAPARTKALAEAKKLKGVVKPYLRLHSRSGYSQPKASVPEKRPTEIDRAAKRQFALAVPRPRLPNVTLRKRIRVPLLPALRAHLLIPPLQVEHRHGIELPRRVLSRAWSRMPDF